jgi:mRNA interferase RelE/StbE
MSSKQMQKLWQVRLDERFHKELKKIDWKIGQEVLDYLKKRIATNEDPRRFGEPLLYSMQGLWRYRVRDYRIICRICDNELLVIALRVGHRKNVYDF